MNEMELYFHRQNITWNAGMVLMFISLIPIFIYTIKGIKDYISEQIKIIKKKREEKSINAKNKR